MRRLERKLKKIQKLTTFKQMLLVGLVFSLCTLGVTAAWATVSYIKPQDVVHEVKVAQKSEIPQIMAPASKSRAPEPATLALFGGGFLGMFASFLRRTYAFVKRIFDIVGSLVGIALSFPLMILTALAVKLTSKGPVLYTQTRVGKGGKLFKIYKFRTMRTDAEKETGPVWATKNDNRITPIGKFLRKSRLDELPQFFNVLFGEMSIIGPRPERPVFVSQFTEVIADYEKRLDVKPGITGLAQVWHRYDEDIRDVRKKVKYDLLYIKKMCFWADLGIIARTVRVVLTGFGAK